MVEDYLRLQSRIHCYEVPTKLHAAYEEVIHLLRRHPDAQGFENQRWDKQRLDQMALRSHAMQHYRLFSTHFYKVLHALISLENYVELQEPLCIDRPYLSVLDIGCGGGAASNALLTFIDNYQELHVINKVPISNVEIRFFGIDPSQTVELIYQNMLKQHSILVSDNLLTTNSHYIAESFNQDTIEILKGQINEGEHIVFVAMSNVVRPLWQQWTKLLPRMAFGTTEGELLLQFVDQIPIDKLVVLNVATQEHGTDSRWGKQLGILLSAIWQLVTGSGHQYWTTGVKETHIEFMNFPASYWVEQRGREASDTTFYQSLSVITHRSYLRDDEWHKTLAHSNLELAWARARYYLNYESLTDRVEIALFDYRLQEHLLKLRKWWEGYRWNHLNTEHACSFLEPKASAAQTRPKMVCRFEESIVSTAIIQKHGWLASNNQQSSYSHRLNTPLDDASEYLYHYWLQKYKDYIEDAQSAVEKQENIVVINTDISSFYTNINQSILLSVVVKNTQISSIRLINSLKKIIQRDCGSHHKPGYGLPQGHVASGFFANMYLDSVDALFSNFVRNLLSNLGFPSTKYFRFADDMFIVVSKRTDSEEILAELRQHLESLGLSLSESKTRIFKSSQEFMETVGLDEFLDKLANRFKWLTSQLYAIPPHYQAELDVDRWKFLQRYAQHLRGIGVHISEAWLSRKIHQYTDCKSTGHTEKTIIFPQTFESASSEWAAQFKDANPRWIEQRADIVNELTGLFARAHNSLIDQQKQPSEATQSKILGRYLRFATYRLAMLDINVYVAQQIAHYLVERPFMMPVKIVTEALARQGYVELLREVYNNTSFSFVRAQSLRSMGLSKDTNTLPILWDVLESHECTEIEKLMASEALITLDLWVQGDTDRALRLVSNENRPYLVKNYVLMACRAAITENIDIKEQLLEVQANNKHSIVIGAVQYALCYDCEQILWPPEPKELTKYYSCYYPDTEGEQQHGQYYGGHFHS